MLGLGADVDDEISDDSEDTGKGGACAFALAAAVVFRNESIHSFGGEPAGFILEGQGLEVVGSKCY